MSPRPERKPPGPTAGRQPASLLTVPVFKDPVLRRPRNRQDDGPEEPAAVPLRDSGPKPVDSGQGVPVSLRGDPSTEPAGGHRDPDDVPASPEYPAEAAESGGRHAPPQGTPRPPSADAPDRHSPSNGSGAGKDAEPRSPEGETADAGMCAHRGDLRRYWRRVGHGRDPEIEDLDAAVIAASWPNTLLIRVAPDGLLDVVQVYGSAEQVNEGVPSAHPLAGDRFSQLSSWILDLARQAARDGAPLETTESFPVGSDWKDLTARVLPCRSRRDAADYVLLNIAAASQHGG